MPYCYAFNDVYIKNIYNHPLLSCLYLSPVPHHPLASNGPYPTIDQIATLSREHILACAYCLHSEAGVLLGRTQKCSKQSISEAIVNILRHSLLCVKGGSTISKPHRVLLRLRITDNPACLRDPQLLCAYLLQLLGPPIHAAFTQCDNEMDEDEMSKQKRYTKRQPPRAPRAPLAPQGPSTDPHSPITDWPKVVPRHIVTKCRRDYYESTKWIKPRACAVCARTRSTAKMKTHLIPKGSSDLPLFAPLCIPNTSPYFNSPCFQFGLPTLNNAMLSSSGVTQVDGGYEVCICDQCNVPLSKSPPQLPKFALKNNLYRGELPAELSDLTWVEEQVCALYRSTAIVTRLYGSDDLSQPHVYRGNTCAFAQNTISTATKLPRTPADVNDLLSVVFTGSAKSVSDACLRNIFRV